MNNIRQSLPFVKREKSTFCKLVISSSSRANCEDLISRNFLIRLLVGEKNPRPLPWCPAIRSIPKPVFSEITAVIKINTAVFSENTAVISGEHSSHEVQHRGALGEDRGYHWRTLRSSNSEPLCSLRELRSSDSTPQFSGEKTAVMP